MTPRPRRIFVTVGSQMPFERLVAAVDRFVGSASAVGAAPALSVLGQVGATASRPRAFESVMGLPAMAYEREVREADLVVAHAGTGTIFTALAHGTPLLVLARRADLGETRNDHQDATALRFEARGLLEYARDEVDLERRLAAWRERWRSSPDEPLRGPVFGRGASSALVARLRAFFDAALPGKEAAR